MAEETNLKIKSKLNKEFLIGAVTITVVVLLVVLVIFVPKSANAKKIQEQLNSW